MTHQLVNKDYDLQQLPTWSGASQTEPSARPETGPMAFGDDWPGVFIRGDNALMYAKAIDGYLGFMERQRTVQPNISKSVLEGLRDLLRSCSVGNTGWPP
jgi:hypothetical protein